MECDKSVRKRFKCVPSFGSGDKKSAEKFTETLKGMAEYLDVKSMDIPEIVKIATHAAGKIGKKREKKSNLGGWSPLSRLIELESCLLGTAIKPYGKPRYDHAEVHKASHMRLQDDNVK